MFNKHFILQLKIYTLCLLFCHGCTFIPEYQQPKAPIPPNWKIRIKKEQGKQVNQMNWQTFYLMPELKNLIQKGLKQNRNLKQAALNMQVVKEQYRIQRSYLFPTIDGPGRYSRQRPAAGAFGGNDNSFIITQHTANIATTAFEIDLFGRLRSMNEAALEEYFSSIEAKNATKILLIAQIANAYLKFLADRDRLKLSQDTAAAQKKSHDIIAKRVEVGVSNELELQQAETLLQQAEVDKTAFQRIIEQDKNALDLLIGSTVSDEELTQSFADAKTFIAEIDSGLPSNLLQNRPDIKQAEHVLKSANANIGVARSSFFPTISLTASGGFGSPELSNLFTGSSKIWSFAPQVAVPIFTAGRNIAGLKVSNLQKDIAIAQYEQTIQNAFREVSDLLVARETMDAELSSQIKLAKAAKGYQFLANARYEKGIDSYLGVLDAIRSTYAAEQEVINKRLARTVNLVNLYTALGGGYDPSEEAE